MITVRSIDFEIINFKCTKKVIFFAINEKALLNSDFFPRNLFFFYFLFFVLFFINMKNKHKHEEYL